LTRRSCRRRNVAQRASGPHPAIPPPARLMSFRSAEPPSVAGTRFSIACLPRASSSALLPETL
jgi:hypothetical protein